MFNEAPVRRLLAPAPEHLREGADALAWYSDDQLARASELLAQIKVDGSQPVRAVLAAVLDYLVAGGVQFTEYDKWAQLDQLVGRLGWGGPLAEFFDIPELAGVQVNGAGRQVIVEWANGRRDVYADRVTGEWAEYLVTRWWTARHPGAQDAGLPGVVTGTLRSERGWIRYTYFGAQHATEGMTLLVRMPLPFPTLEQLVDRGMLTADAAAWLAALVKLRMNILVSGGTGAGKTTLVNALLRVFDPLERVAIVEEVAELWPAGMEGAVSYEVGASHHEEELGALLRANLFNSVTRLVLGEARGGEAAHLITAMTSGVQGCIATIHAPSAESAPLRLAQYARQGRAMANLGIAELCRIIARLNLAVVHVGLNLESGGPRRRVTEMSLVLDAHEDHFTREVLFRLSGEGQLVWAEPALERDVLEALRRVGARVPRPPSKR